MNCMKYNISSKGGITMVLCRLKILLAERNLSITDTHKATGISRNTLTALCYNYSKGIQYETMDSLCRYLNVTPSDLFEYTPVDISVLEINLHNAEMILSVVPALPRHPFNIELGIDFKVIKSDYDSDGNGGIEEINTYIWLPTSNIDEQEAQQKLFLNILNTLSPFAKASVYERIDREVYSIIDNEIYPLGEKPDIETTIYIDI